MKKTYLNVVFALGTIFFFVPESSAEEIPVAKAGGVYEVPVLINEVITLNFVLDSGAAEVTIPADVALTLVRAGTVTKNDFLPGKTYVLGDGSQVKSPRFVLRSLKVGNSMASNVVGSISNARGPLLLGQSFLEKLGPWTLNTEKKVLAIGNSAAPNIPQQVQTSPTTNAPSESNKAFQAPAASKTTSSNDGKEKQSGDCLLPNQPRPPIDPSLKQAFDQYISVLQSRVKSNWNPSQQSSSAQTALRFTVLKNGEICNLKVATSSGNPVLDEEALQTARKSAPFAPLPSEYKGQDVDISFTLKVNAKSAADNTLQARPATDEDKYLQEGNALFKQKDYTGAIKSFSQAISNNSKFVRAYRARGNSYATIKDFSKAIEDYTQVIRLEPNDSNGYYFRGVIYFNQKNFKNALEDFSKAISMSPKYAQAYYSRGNVYTYQKDFKKSIENYTQAISAFPNYAKAYRARGNVYYLRKDQAKAIEDYQKASEIFQKQGQAKDSQAMLDLIKQIQQSL